MHTLWQDLRYGMRTLLKQPGFTLIAVLTLALGICGVTTQFSIVDAALLRGLPFPEPDRLVRITMRDPSWAPDRDRNPWLSDVIEFGKETRSFDGLAGYSYAAPVIANISGMPQRLSGCHVTSNFFALLGVRPALGQCARIVPTTAPTPAPDFTLGPPPGRRAVHSGDGVRHGPDTAAVAIRQVSCEQLSLSGQSA